MFAIDSLVIDLVFTADAKPRTEDLLDALGGEEGAKSLLILDPDVDFPQYELQVAPTVPLRRRGERRLLIVDEATAPMRKSPQTEPIVPRDLRPARERLVTLVEKTSARFGRLNAYGTWGDAAVVVRSARDLRGLFLVPWALDPTVDLEGRRRAGQLSQREFEAKLAVFDKRLDEIDEAGVLGRVPPAHAERRGALLVVDTISDRDGSWDTRKSLELTQRVAALDLFARIPGAPVTVPDGVAAAEEPPAAPRATTAQAATAAAPAPAAAPPPPSGPPLDATEIDGRVVLVFPEERFDLDAVTALGRNQLDAVRQGDHVSGQQRDRIADAGAGFVAPLVFLSEVFLDGKPLDRRRFEAEARAAEGVRVLEAHLPRFGAVLVVERAGRRFVTSELALPFPRVIELVDKVGARGQASVGPGAATRRA